MASNEHEPSMFGGVLGTRVGLDRILTAVIENSTEFIAWHGIHNEAYLNQTAANMVGIEDRSVPLAGRVRDLFVPASRRLIDGLGVRVLNATGSWRAHLKIAHRVTGEVRTLDWAMFLVRDADGSILGTAGMGRDITDQQHALEQVRASELRFRSLFEVSPLGIAVFDDELRLTQTNPALAVMTQRSAPELLGLALDDLVTPVDPGTLDRVSQEVSGSDLPSIECLLTARTGQIHVNLTASWIPVSEDRVDRLVVMLEDISDRVAAREHLRELAETDALTGLANRATLLSSLSLAQATAGRNALSVALLFIDMDHFKSVNDTLGHTAGDALLQAVALRLHNAVRPGDLAARLGGDEFAVLCPNLPADLDQAEQVAADIATRISSALSLPLTLGQQDTEVTPTASIGVAIGTDDLGTAEQLLEHADAAMYRAKRTGRSRVQLFDDGLRRDHVKDAQLVAELRKALLHDELALHYQPILDVGTGELRGFEALLRWRHPRLGLLLPLQFLGHVELAGLMHPIGSWVIDQALTTLAGWIAEGAPDTLFVSVNLAAAQVGRGDLGHVVTQSLESHGLRPQNLWLEIVENVVLSVDGVAQLGELADAGVQLALDDFGTGHASLTHLRGLPVSIVKIDRTFVADLDGRPDGARFLSSIVDLAHSLGHVVVAEGVESAAQHAAIRAAGCELVQGYWHGRPESAQEARARALGR